MPYDATTCSTARATGDTNSYLPQSIFNMVLARTETNHMLATCHLPGSIGSYCTIVMRAYATQELAAMA
jgi:hypothetical protein